MGIFSFLKRKPKQASSEKIRKMFSTRQEMFAWNTASIWNRMPVVMEAIQDYFKLDAEFDLGGVLEWVELTLGVNDENTEIMLMVGSIQYPPGAEVPLRSGEKVKITTDTAPYFKKVIRIGLPLRMVDKSKEDIIEYLKKADEENQAERQEMKEAITQALGAVTAPPKVKKDDTIATGDDFDLTQLTEDQRKQLTLLSKTKQ